MTLCEQCGSISIGRAYPVLADKLVRLFTGRRPFVCRRCGWKGRRSWTDADLRKLKDYGAGGAEPDPALAVLDADGSPALPPQKPAPAAPRFDLAGLDLANAAAHHDTPAVPASPSRRSGERGISRKRRSRSRKKEIVATVAVVAIVLAAIAVVWSSWNRRSPSS